MKVILCTMNALLISSLAYAIPSITSINIPYEPLGFIISKNETRAYVSTGKCSEWENKGEVDAIDLKEMKIIGKIDIPLNSESCLSGELFLTDDDQKLYVDFGKAIFVIDTTKFKIIKTIKMEKNDYIGEQTIMSPDQTKIYYNVTTSWGMPNNYRNFLVLDTKKDIFIDKIPNSEETCVEGCFHLAATVISPNGNYIYEIPEAYYKMPQRLIAMNVLNKKSTLLNKQKEYVVNNGLILSKNGDTFYMSVYEDLSPNPVEDWYVYAINKNTMERKELYHAEHKVRAIQLSGDEKQLYILDLRERHKKITIVNTVTRKVIKDIPMANLMTNAKVSSNPNLQTIYFTTNPGGGNESSFNVMSSFE